MRFRFTAIIAMLFLLRATCAFAELQNVEVGGGPRIAAPQDNAASPTRTFTIEARFYQVLTNITDDGLNTRTLPGMDGWFQELHQRLDQVALVMEGTTLAWDGKEEPDYPRIIGLSAPSITTRAGEKAILTVGASSPTQYMRPVEGEQFILETLRSSGNEPEIGTMLAVTPKEILEGGATLMMDFAFHYNWIKDRQKLEGVNLDVGKPILGHVSTESEVQIRLGEWSCYVSPVGSDGAVYVFVRVTPASATPAAKTEVPTPVPTVSVVESPSDDAKSKGIKNIEVGGSMRLRWEHRTGGPKL